MTGVFLSYGPLLKGAFLGLGKCLIWAGLTGPYAVEVACYQDGVLQKINVDVPGSVTQGDFVLPDGTGSISWLVKPDGSFELGIQPADGASNRLVGKF